MSSKPTLDGPRAREMFGDMADIATRIVENAADALLEEHQGDREAVITALSNILRDGMLVQRITTLLESGRPNEAEALIKKGVRTG